jgi:hypothetical protein
MSYSETPTNDQVAACDDLWGVDGIEVTELFRNSMGELVVKLTGLPDGLELVK